MNNRLLAMFLVAALPAAVCGGETAGEVRGDVLVIEEVPAEATPAPARNTDRAMPSRGMDMENVRNIFGEPLDTHPAVGEPPITRWDYDGYSVFFEHDKVIHSVVTE